MGIVTSRGRREMNRYFYTDPLAAAWMAKHFKMKLESRHTDEQMSDYDIPESERWFDWFDSCVVDGCEIEMVRDAVRYIENASGKIYIHPDSVHLLEAVAGDLVWEPEKHTGARLECETAYIWQS